MADLPSLVPSGPVTSRRLRLRPMTVADVADVVAVRQQPEVYAYLSHGELTASQLETRLQLRIARMTMPSEARSSVEFVVELRETGTVVGDCGARVQPVWTKDDAPTEHLDARVHYSLDAGVAGRGLGTELVGLLTDAVFAEPRVHRVQADVFADNLASRRVLEHNGYGQEAYFTDDGIIDGAFVDACIYSLRRREWEGR